MSSEHPTGERTSRHWLMVALSIGLALAVALSMALADDAEAKKKKKTKKNYTETSTVAQSGVTDVQVEVAEINGPAYSFPKAANNLSITSVHFRATITDGDTAPGEFDENDLTLALDGIDTGIVLNGYRGGQTDTLTFTGAPQNAAQILAALKADNQLNATIIDSDAADNNTVDIPTQPNTTLALSGQEKKKKKKKK